MLEGFFCCCCFFFYHPFRKWIEHSKLREINFKIVEFNPVVLKGKIRPDSSRPELLQPVSRDGACGRRFLVRPLSVWTTSHQDAPGRFLKPHSVRLPPNSAYLQFISHLLQK